MARSRFLAAGRSDAITILCTRSAGGRGGSRGVSDPHRLEAGASVVSRKLVEDGKERSKSLFTKYARIVESPASIEIADRVHFARRQLEVENRQVFAEPLDAGRLRDDGRAALHAPPQHDLSRRPVVMS